MKIMTFKTCYRRIDNMCAHWLAASLLETGFKIQYIISILILVSSSIKTKIKPKTKRHQSIIIIIIVLLLQWLLLNSEHTYIK